MVPIDEAIAENEGEEVVTAVLSHEVEEKALYFEVQWENGTTSSNCPLDDFVDADDERTNLAVASYAKAHGLDLKPFLDVLLPILRGQRDLMSLSVSDEDD